MTSVHGEAAVVVASF